MTLSAWEEVAAGPLRFVLGDKTYEAKPIGIKTGRRLNDVLAGGEVALQELPADDFWRLILGDLFDEMLDDDVPELFIARAGRTVLNDYRYGRPAATAYWETESSPEAVAARAAANTETSTNTGGASTTKPRASTKVTTSPKTTRRAAKKAPAGKQSSSSGG